MSYNTKNKHIVTYLHLLGIEYIDIIEEYSDNPVYIYKYIPENILNILDNFPQI